MCYNGRIITEYNFLRIKGVLMDMTKDLEAFSIAFDNGINDNNFVDSLCDSEFISKSQEEEILNQVQNDNMLDNNSLCHPEFSSGSLNREILKQVQNDNMLDNNSLCHPEFISGSLNREILKQVQNDSAFVQEKTELVGARKAFTLSESLIMMAIVGVIAVITLVSLSGLKPNKDKMLLQKAHRATLEAVAEIANDAVAYPPLKSADLRYRENLLFAVRRQVQLALFTPDLTNAITDSGLDCTIWGTTGGGLTGGFTGSFTGSITGTYEKYCMKTDANGNPIETTNSDGIIDFVRTTDCPKTTTTFIPITATFTLPNTTDTGTTGGGETLKPAGNSHTDSVLPNIGSAGETKTAGNVTITPASAVLTDRSVPTRDTGKYTATNKFAYLFAHTMQPSGKDISCTNNVCTFKTADGMDWTVTDGFSASNVNSTATILVDINGSKNPNKAYNPSNPNEVKTPDRFTFTVRANGQVTVPNDDVVAQRYLQSRQ
mgnify:CR=1 FL=1